MKDEQLMMHFITSPPIQDGTCYKSTLMFHYSNKLDYHVFTIAIRNRVTGEIDITDIKNSFFIHSSMREQAMHWQDTLKVLISAYEALEGYEPRMTKMWKRRYTNTIYYGS